MFGEIIITLFLFSNVLFTSEASKPRCAVVIFVNQSSTNDDFSDYLDSIKGLTLNKTNVFFSDDPDTFKVKHGLFINAPGLFALESEKYPGMFLRRSNHTIIVQHKRKSESFKNDATFLMDDSEKNETYSNLKLFTHRSWKLFSSPDVQGPLLFDTTKERKDHQQSFDLLVLAQPCMGEDVVESLNNFKKNTSAVSKSKTSKPKQKVFLDDNEDPDIKNISLNTTSLLYDPVLNQQSDTKFITAITNKGKSKTISNEYSFDDFKIPDFIMHSLVEDDKNAGDGMEMPKPATKPSASFIENKEHQQKIEHQNKLPTVKEKISELSSLLDDNELDDIQETLGNLQYGSKGCKLLVAEDTVDEDAAAKDIVAHPKKECKDEFADSCKEMAQKGHCLSFKSLMSSVCRKSCNLCASLVDTGFTKCSKSCGGGRQMRMIKIRRREYLQTRRCNIKPCPVDGGYSEFGNFTECSATCGKGVQYRRRTCTNPRPQFNGRSCKRLGPSIESRRCDTEPCPDIVKHRKYEDHHNTKKKHIKNSKHRKTGLHIGGKHSNKVHEHLILLKGKKVAKLQCRPRKGQLRSVIQDEKNYKRFIIHGSETSKRSNIEEENVVYNKEGLPFDTSKTIVNAFKSPYKIILARNGPNKMKLVEECLEADDDVSTLHSTEDRVSSFGTELSDPETAHSLYSFLPKGFKGKNKVYTRPGEKSFDDFEEYKYEKGNVVTPEVTTTSDNKKDDYSTPTGKLFGQSKGLDFFIDKINAVKPRVDDQLSEEDVLESSNKIENAPPAEGLTFNDEQLEHEGDTDSASRAGFAVTTLPDNPPPKPEADTDSSSRAGFTVTTLPDNQPSKHNGGNDDNGDSDGYQVENVEDNKNWL